ncbi:NADP-dependent oxidoreductase [Georgenia thermotolerans]|uniref:Zinc-binding dehydrogenase n=1 Tax=Georgenia thermotolerans TaxID=527326 RepID=A0A7J5UPP8_9MICO|nr:NADP-dependent oxidoreductase [Georgenia thermotolerans]KAE8764388.1 zinc-binding dehydrogenase [Georgenia thermotolerans]
MRAIGVTQFGGPDQLEVVNLPEPHAGPGEVRVRVRAATVNPTDTGLRAGLRAQALEQAGLRPPYIPGMELAGEIDEVGDGAPWCPGEQVMAIALPVSPHGGAYAEQVVVPAAQVARVPVGTDLVRAATVPMNGLTALLALDGLGLRTGQTVAITGAAGALGGYAVQLAKARGLRVVADASERDEELVRSLGADAVVRRGPDVVARLRQVVPEGVPGLVDASVQLTEVVPAIADGGTLAVVRGWDGEPGRGIRLHRVMVAQVAGRTDWLDELRRDVEEGRLTPRVARTFPAEQAPEAHRVLEAGGTRGRLVLTF